MPRNAMSKIVDPPPVTAGEIKYQGHLNYVEAIDITSEKVLWHTLVYPDIKPDRPNPKLEKDVQWNIITSLTVEKDRIDVRDGKGRTYQLDRITGKPIQQGGNAPVLIKNDELTGVIFTSDREMFGAELGATAYWTPTKNQVLEAEAALKKYLSKEHPDLVTRLPKYKRQYSGLVVKDKEILFMNLFGDDPSGHSKHWMEGPVDVEDGGDWYFDAQYDIKKKSIVRMYVHGQA